MIIFITTIGYGIDTISYATTGLKNKTMDIKNVEDYIKVMLPDDYVAIQWIKENLDRDSVILQKVDGSYTLSTRISAFTANPTVLGWHGHEWVWRAKADYSVPDEVDARWNDIFQIYNSEDKEYVKSLIEKYDIDYIYIESTDKNFSTLFKLGEIVYTNGTNYAQSPVYIIKVNDN